MDKTIAQNKKPDNLDIDEIKNNKFVINDTDEEHTGKDAAFEFIPLGLEKIVIGTTKEGHPSNTGKEIYKQSTQCRSKWLILDLETGSRKGPFPGAKLYRKTTKNPTILYSDTDKSSMVTQLAANEEVEIVVDTFNNPATDEDWCRCKYNNNLEGYILRDELANKSQDEYR